jgi:hypothetical protein
MPIFNWDEEVYCGDAPPASCDPIPEVDTVTAPHGTNPSGGCPADLISPDHPALLVSLSDVQTQLRSGAAARPIPIDLVQKTSSPVIPTLMFRNAAGQMAVWDPGDDCLRKRVIYDAGDFQLADDINSNIFDEACIGNYSDVEYMVGARRFTDCNGQTKIKLVFFPVAELPVAP